MKQQIGKAAVKSLLLAALVVAPTKTLTGLAILAASNWVFNRKPPHPALRRS